MGLRILHSADWHMGSPFSSFPPGQREYLKKEQQKVPGKIAELVRRENCDLVLLSGDIFDEPLCPKSRSVVREALRECGVPVLIAPGNHDYLTTGSPWLEESWPENVHIFSDGISSVVLPELDCRIYGAGYRQAEAPGLLENFRAEGTERYQLAVLHGDPMRLQSPYCPVTMAQIRDSGLDYLALGHIHKAGTVSTPDTLCGWPGTPMGRGYDETREKGLYIVELEDRPKLRFVPLDTPRFFDLEADMDCQGLEELLPPADSANFYRVTLTGGLGEAWEQLRLRYREIANLEIIDRREKKTDLWAAAGEDTLEGTYFRILRDRLAQAGEEEGELIRLAAEISRKILGGKEVEL